MKELPAIFDGKRRRLMLRLIINSLLQAGSIVISMLLVRHAFDVLLNPAFDDPDVHMFDVTEVWQIFAFAGGLLTVTGFAAWLRMMERIDAERLGQDYVHQLRIYIFRQMSRFAPRALSRRSTGAAMLRFVGDLGAIRRWVSLGLARVVVTTIVSSIAIGFLATLDIYLASGTFVILTLGVWWNLMLGPRLHRSMTEARRLRGRLAGNINDKIRSFSVILAFNQVRREKRRFTRHSEALTDAMIERAKVSGRMRVVTDGAMALSMGMILSLGAFEVFHGMTTSGNVVAAMAVAAFLATGMRDMSRIHEHRQGFLVSRKKITDFVSTRPMRGRSSKLPDLLIEKGHVRLEDVSLNHILNGLNAEVPGGSRVALTGANGAGKSTLLHVLARLIDINSGAVYIDGQNIEECNLASVRSALGIVSPDLPLLRGSLRYNLRYRWPDAPEHEVVKICDLCGVTELIEHLPGGEKYRINEGGQNLSLGQRHRLSFARALLGNPRLLIVDEVDANLDVEAGEVFDQVLDQFSGTVFMVTRSEHRLQRADYFWHIEDGTLRVEKNSAPLRLKARTGSHR